MASTTHPLFLAYAAAHMAERGISFELALANPFLRDQLEAAFADVSTDQPTHTASQQAEPRPSIHY